MSQWDVLKLKNQLKNQLKKKFFKASSVLLHLVLFWPGILALVSLLGLQEYIYWSSGSLLWISGYFCNDLNCDLNLCQYTVKEYSSVQRFGLRGEEFGRRIRCRILVLYFYLNWYCWRARQQLRANNSVKEERIKCKCESNHRLLSLNPNFIRSNTNRFILTLQNRT